jgi:hypothetical protein
MGVDYFTCKSCKEIYNDCGYYSTCDLCENHCGCIHCEYDGKFDYIMDGEEYVLCNDCMPKKHKIVKAKRINKDYDEDCKYIEKELKEQFKPKLAKGETTEEIDRLEERRNRRKKRET